ncbi:polysaccharide deacetylase family protein [Congregibacter litoralis]|uniref:Putative xylanase/chitin deacetylase n=1 Tax=Congregibacter litoralis KT71 TaxID=314285 RepID=A4A7I8_9GAMM|nr:polysaccharide deacetylase family protein [Congregibacter litoralis]EAQ98257.1 putative xylanase/chitin deacetylase [Congregibacter litoralis KT71]
MTVLMAVLIVLALVFSHRYAWWRSSVDYRRPRILMYHMVSEPRPGAKFNKLRVTPANFERQLCWLRKEGWHFAFMSDLQPPASLPAKTVILTFDDGYEDNLLNAAPVLERHDARATLYVVEDRFDRDWSTSKKAHHDSGELMREAKLSDEQLEQMIASGRWELGGHTRTHANLSTLDADQRKTEIGAARESLARRFAVPVDSFAYPFGIYGAEDVAAARAAGFSTAVTTEEGIPEDISAQAMELPRIKVSGKDSMLAFKLRMRTGFRGL